MTMIASRTFSTARHGTGAILFTMCLGVFLAQLDSTVVYLGVKHIGGELDASISQMQWVLDAYNLTYATFLLTGGTLGDLYGRTRIFIVGIALIVAGSLVCALAPNGNVLIAGRALTGLGSALELPVSLAILTVAYPDANARGRAIGFWASCNGLAMAIGPSVGGFLVDSVGWRSIFFLSVPVGIVGLVLAATRVPETRHPEGRHLDPAGQALAVIALAALAFVVIEGPHWGFLSASVLIPAVACVLAAILFLRVESGSSTAMVPLDLFRNGPFNASLAIAGLMTFGMYSMMFLTPLYLQSVAHTSALVTGLALMPMSVVFMVVSQCSGWLMKRLGARVMMTAGMGAMGAGLLILLAVVSPQGHVTAVEVALIVIGIGLGLNTGPVNAVAVASVSAARSGTASGLLNTARMIGATLGIAVLGATYAVHAGDNTTEGMLTGLRLAFLGGAVGELAGMAIALVFTRADSMERKAR
jgi:EmrB/QacA subfamily drug resistance transporter